MKLISRRTRRFEAACVMRMLRVVYSPERAPWATMIALPGSGQSLNQFDRQFHPQAWALRGVHVVGLQPRFSTGRTWRPGPMYPRSDAAWIDIRGIRALWIDHIDADESLRGLPLWIAGHSGGACFAHVAAWTLAAETEVAGVVSNAGWVWPWLEQRHLAATHRLLPRRAAFRVGDRDRLFRASRRRTAFDGADTYRTLGVEVAAWTTPGRHEWLADHDDELAAWMHGG